MADYSLESGLLARGYKNICGLDEVGRGALFGPVVAGAVILRQDCLHPEINDSKKLRPGKRVEMARFIYANAKSFSLGWSWPDEIDSLNVLHSTRLAMERALAKLPLRPDYLLIDGLQPDFQNLPGMMLIKGDQRSYSIAAASIIAKVFRDQLVAQFSFFFPEYELHKNFGYPTKKHKFVVLSRGMTLFHRRTFCCRHEH